MNLHLHRDYTNNYSERSCNTSHSELLVGLRPSNTIINDIESTTTNINHKLSGTVIESRKYIFKEKQLNSKYHVVNFVKSDSYNNKMGIVNIKVNCDSNLIKSITLSIAGMHFDRFYPNNMKELISIDLFNKTIIPITDQDIMLYIECDNNQNIELFYDIIKIDNPEILKSDILIPFKQIASFGTETLRVKNNVEIIDVKYIDRYDKPLESVRLVTDQRIKNIALIIDNALIYPTQVKENIYLFDLKCKKVTDIQKIMIYNNTDINELNINVFAEVWNICVCNENGCDLLFSS
jgi:hypothetical protein